MARRRRSMSVKTEVVKDGQIHSPEQVRREEAIAAFQSRKKAGNPDDAYTGPAVPFSHTASSIAAEHNLRPENNLPPYARDDEELPIEVDGPLPDSNYSRINPSSNCIFYDFKSIGIRPFTAEEIIYISAACASQDATMLYDIIGQTLTVNVRDLWWGDFRYIMVWHRLNSYTQIPYQLSWNTMYGNKRKDEIRNSAITNRNIRMTREEFQKYKAEGLSFPTVRLSEEFFYKQGDDKKYKALFNKAQYVIGNTIDEKINNIKKVSVSGLMMINEFKDILNDTGVFEYIVLQDVDYKKEPKKTKEFLEWSLKALVSIHGNDGISKIEKLTLEDKMNKVKLAIETYDAGEAGPVPETIAVEFSQFNFFPQI